MLIGVELRAVRPSMFPLYESRMMESLIQVKKENYLIGFLKILIITGTLKIRLPVQSKEAGGPFPE